MNIKKRLFIILLIILCLSSSVLSYAHDAYFVSITIDPGSYQYIASVNFESNEIVAGNHAEQKNNAVFSYLAASKSNVWDGNVDNYINLINSDGTDDDMRNFYLGENGDGGTLGMISWESANVPDNATMAFTFPGLHLGENAVASFFKQMGAQSNATSEDQALANRVVSYPVDGLNSCLSLIRNQCYNGRVSSMEVIMKDAVKLANAAAKKSSTTINGHTVTVTSSNIELGDNSMGVTKEDYVKVTVNGVSGDFCWRCPKGYHDISSDTMAATGKSSDYLSTLRTSDAPDVKYIDWSLIVLQGNYNADVTGLTFSTLDTIVNPGTFTSLIGGLIGWAITGTQSFLQLKEYEAYMLCLGKIESSWVYGLFPETWLAPTLLLYSVCLMIAMSLVGFSILKILWKKQLSTVNIGEKIAMQESIKNLIVTLFLFFAFIPIFMFLAGLNSSLVNLFESSVDLGSGLFADRTISFINMGSIVTGIAGLIIDIYFNFFYTVRAITIVVLVGISPLAIYSLSLGGKMSGVFSAYFKELISNIFVQTIHAIILAFFFNMSSLSSLTPFEEIVIMYSFIPITNFVKTKIFQLTEGVAGGVAGAATAGMAGGAASAAGNMAGGGKDRDGGGGSGGSSGGEGLTSDSVLSSAIDRTSQTQRAAAGGRQINMQDMAAASPDKYNWGGMKIRGGTGVTKNQNYSTDQSGYRSVYTNKDSFSPTSSSDSPTRMMDQVVDDKQAAAFVKGAGQIAGGLLYASAAMGMTAIGQNPNKYFEMAGKQFGRAGAGIHQANKESSLYYDGPDSLRNQIADSYDRAGIIEHRDNGAYSNYVLRRSKTNAYNREIHDDLVRSYTKDESGNYSDQQLKAQQYYRDNYGIMSVNPNAGPYGTLMDVHISNARMQTARLNASNPFANMKAYNWKEEKKTPPIQN